MRRFSIIGAGAWGTALALVVGRGGGEALIWAHEEDVAQSINRGDGNPRFLPGIPLGPGIRATTDLAGAAKADALLLATPAQHLRQTLGRLAPHLGTSRPLVLCAKGIEQGSGLLMTEVAESVAPGHRLAVLSGPSFAAEVALELPTAVTLATTDPQLGSALAEALASRRFRPYLSDDPVGAELGGAVKNVLAIAAGIVEGARLGDNARAALITRGLAEMLRLGLAKGARSETLAGLSGLGDLVLTCTGGQSRNHGLGVALGQGRSLADALGSGPAVVEGVTSAAAVLRLAHSLGVDMPIAVAVDAVLTGALGVAEAIAGLLERPLKREDETGQFGSKLKS
ncbi:MAG: NAD(P)-dependent glycerol-3-phosphate dehydrogenase [Proteobacteria bacterium]|nr:NAD(P)-dependent glycerol-3-phosphate dehydrogenase [Pseudomonadota bacterium]MBI3497066.1 NAD(P)-dependent glycerol-3-phosphate dehydrogenase [Pseudomonadota bacterium]